MFDPPDFPFKDLSDTLKDHYDPEDILLSGPATSDPGASKSLAEVTEQMIASVENQLSFHSNDTGRFFNIENGPFLENINGEQSTELYIVQPNDTLLNYEHTLLDENTVNQFLLPLQTSEGENKDAENVGPDVLALHSCVICHDIFITEADLLDHTIAMHASNKVDENEVKLSVIENKNTSQREDTGNVLDFETEWLVCTLCQRVLSTALEVEPSELLCCIDTSGKANMCHKKLHTMYVCEVCNALFASGEALDNHRGDCYVLEQPAYYAEQMLSNPKDPNQGPEVLFSCDTCCKQYMTAEDLRSHAVECQPATPRRGDRRAYSANKSTKMWNCGSCNQLFATARELYRHKRGEDRQPGAPLMVYTCEECDKVLGSMCALHTHKKMHKVSKPGYPCRVCGRRFNQSGHLAIHMRMHTGERPYPCDLCSKAFKVKVERDDHRRTHTGERPFACTACPKTFTAAARLREHARIHTDQRPYRCDICGAAFRRPYARTVHTLIHTGEKPHECDVCGTAFRRSGDMWKHKRTLHGILPSDI